MRKDIRIILAMLPFAVASCAVEPIPSTEPAVSANGPKIMVSTEGVTRTTLASDFKVNWASGDAISVFDGAANLKYTTTGTTPAAEFTTDGSLATASAYYALYPYSAAATLDGSTIKTVIPNYQKGVKGGFDPAAQLMVGKGSSASFAMKNVVALFKVTIPADVTAVTIANKAGVPIAGNVSITVGDDGVPTAVTAESSSVLLLPDGETFEAGDYYVAVAPGALTGGMHVTMTKSGSDNLWVADSDNPCTLYRSEVMNLGDLGAKTAEKAMTKLSIIFSNGSAWQSPFAYPASFSTSESTANYGGSPITATFKPLYYSFQIEMFADRGFTQNSTGGLRCCRDEGDYVTFPVINGTRLAAVKAIVGGNIDYPALTDGSGQILVGGDPYRVRIYTGQTVLWTPVGTENGVAYRVTAQTPAEPDGTHRWFAVRQFDLYYEGTPAPTFNGISTESPIQAGTTATLKGYAAVYGDISGMTCGFDYKLDGASDWTTVTCDAPAAEFSKTITLPVGEYVYKAWASVGGVKKYGEEKPVSFYTGMSIDIVFGPVPNKKGAVCYKDNNYFPTNGAASCDAEGYSGKQYNNFQKILTYDFGTGYDFRLWSRYGISRSTATVSGVSTILGLRFNPQGNVTVNGTKVYAGGKDGVAWMQLPGIDGFVLKSVTAKTRASGDGYGTWTLVSDVTPDATPTATKYTVASGAKTLGSMSFASATEGTIEATGAEAGVGYYLLSGVVYAHDFTELHLIYELAE